jgi:predicted nucleic acid-binding Zn ribbon protein
VICHSSSKMDERMPCSRRWDEQIGPVTPINRFTVEPDEADRLLTAWAADAAWMKQQPGFISTQLYGGIGGKSGVEGSVVSQTDSRCAALGRSPTQDGRATAPRST